MAKYQINKKKEIIKTDFEERYNIADFVVTLTRAEKALRELEANAEMHKQKFENVEEYHPVVKKISEEDKNAIWMYHENFVAFKRYELEIKELKKRIKGVKAEMKDIENQTGVNFE